MTNLQPIRFRAGLLVVGALTAVSLLGTPRSAHANLIIAAQEAGVNGGVRTTIATGADFTSASFSGTYGDFKLTVFSGAADNGVTLSDLLQSTTSVQNLSGTTKTITLYVTQTNYTLPTDPTSTLFAESGMGGSINNGTTLGLTGIYQAYLDKNNNAFGTSDFTNGPQNATLSGRTFDTGSAVGVFSRLPTDYSATTVATIQLSGGRSTTQPTSTSRRCRSRVRSRLRPSGWRSLAVRA